MKTVNLNEKNEEHDKKNEDEAEKRKQKRNERGRESILENKKKELETNIRSLPSNNTNADETKRSAHIICTALFILIFLFVLFRSF